ncbi:nuclear transport factor 2 family protein [Novosphingobium sp. G106]|uniref:nuclear transport factor 2 family protein n=1 Tax=Novosphingobium sp. G106 TaxID=2849500 RepID=UPI001C2D9ECC|nr:nuclear transport factor 2 family protein [Novosphingobium sp. G106]MBV1686158.1 nuclear transport factor 2 family protein [Novosphingobium sp. G106]
MSGSIESAVLAAEKRRCDAMLANDNAALEALLDPRLHFSHATGAIDDKAALLAKMAAGRIHYVAITWSEEKVTPLGPDAALLTGRMTTDVRVEGVDKRLNNRVITVWSKAGDDWRLVAVQSTPLAG